jgi:hypothetical protein
VNEFVIDGSLPLEQGGTLLIDEGREMLVYVWRGVVWVTQEGEQRDRLLTRGDWIRIDRDGRTVVQALEPSALALTSPYDEDYAVAISRSGAKHPRPVALYRGRPRSLAAMLNRAARAWNRLVGGAAAPQAA